MARAGDDDPEIAHRYFTVGKFEFRPTLNWLGLLIFNSVATFPEEISMKRVIVALVLALSVVSVVGCGSGSPTKTGSGK